MPTSPNLQLIGGNFQDFEGNVLDLGYLIVQLSHDAEVFTVPCQVVSGYKLRINLNSSGSIPSSPAVLIWSSDILQPGGTYYIVMAYKSDGTQAWSNPQYWSLASSPNPLDVGTIIPSNPPGSGLIPMSPAVLLNPLGDQTISAFNLLPAAGNTTQSLGFQGALWDAILHNVSISGYVSDIHGFQGFGRSLASTGVGGVQWAPAGSGPQGLSPQGFQGFQGPAIAGSIAFSSITTGSNTSAAMTVGSGASMTTSGTGTINANKLEGVTISGTPSTGQTLVATSSSAADWATGFLNLPANGLRLEYGGATGTTTVTFSPAFGGTPSVLLSTGPGTGTTQLNTTSSTQFTTVSSDGAPFTWLAIGPA